MSDTQYKGLHNEADGLREVIRQLERALTTANAEIERLKGERGATLKDAEIYIPIFDELRRAVAKFPTWPTDPLHAVAVLGEEFGELTKDVLQFTYEPHKTNSEKIKCEAIQTAAMALRFFLSLDVYHFDRSIQHVQDALASADALTMKDGYTQEVSDALWNAALDRRKGQEDRRDGHYGEPEIGRRHSNLNRRST